MASKLFRCTNRKCREGGKPYQFEFVPTVANVDPTCAKCGCKANDPKYGRKIVRIARLHFNPESDVHGIRHDHRACDPSKSIQVGGGIVPGLEAPNPFHAGTSIPDVVNCPECRATPEWEKAFLEDHSDEPPMRLQETLRRLEVFAVHAPVPVPEPVPASAPS
jgi:hypothetical protein